MTSYGQLQTDVSPWLTRTDADLSAKIDIAMRMMWPELGHRIRIRDMITETALTYTSDAQTLPADFKEAIAITRGDLSSPVIRLVNPQAFRRYARRDQSGVPAEATIQGGELLVAPGATASANVTVNLLYYAWYDLPVDPADTNYLFTNAYNVVFYSMLAKLGETLQDDEMISRYERLAERAIMLLHEDDQRSTSNGGPRIVNVHAAG